MVEHNRGAKAMDQLWEAIQRKSDAFHSGNSRDFIDAKNRFEQIERDYSDQKAVIGKALLDKAECLEQLGQHDDALNILDSVAKEFVDVDREAVAAAHMMAGYILTTVHENYESARERFTKSAEFTDEPEVRAESQVWVGNCWLWQKEYQKAAEVLEDVAERTPPSPERLRAEDLLGVALVLQGRLEDASAVLTGIRKEYPFMGDVALDALETEQVLKLCMAGRYGLPQLEWNEELKLKGYTAWIADLVRGREKLPPLCASVFCDYSAHGTQHTAAVLSSPTTRGWDWRLIEGYPYYTVIQTTKEEVPERETRFREQVRGFIEYPKERWAKAVEEILELYRPIKDVDLGSSSGADLQHLFYHCLHTYRRLHEMRSFWDFVTCYAYGVFEEVCEELMGVTASDPLFMKLMGGFDNVLLGAERDAWRLAGYARELELTDVFLTIDDNKDVINHLGESEDGREWLQEYSRFLAAHGWRCSRTWDWASASWVEEPSLGIPGLRKHVAAGRHLFGPDIERERLVKERIEAEGEITARVSSERREWFQRLLRIAQFHGSYAEDRDYYLDMMGNAVCRKVVNEIGERFMKEGLLDDCHDVFNLTTWEIRQGFTKATDLRPSAKSHREEFESYPDILPAPFFGDLESFVLEVAINDPVLRTELAMPTVTPELKADLFGVPGAPGVAEGLARVLFSPEDLLQVQPGEILVAPSTSPAWTYIFNVVGAVVTDGGGHLTHAVVVGREYGIPTVVGTMTATQKIKTGDRIRVDGNMGAVYILAR